MRRIFTDNAGRATALPALVILLALLYLPCTGLAATVCVLDSGCSEGCTDGRSFIGDPADLSDGIGHGTRICALIREGAPDARIVMLKCFDTQQSIGEEAIIDALYAAVDDYEADVINMSWTLGDESEALREAIVHASESGAVLVACTGNLSLTTGLGTIAYPAAWDEVIGVAGADPDADGVPQTSLWYLYGKAVDFCARGSCGAEKGSSFAAARVSGMIAQMLEDGMQPADIRERLAEIALDMGESGCDEQFGWGYLKTP